VPVLGRPEDVLRVVDFYEVECVAVLAMAGLDDAALRRLATDLQHTRAELLLAPVLAEPLGPGMRLRPAMEAPLLQVERSELRGARRLAKEAFDRGVASVVLLLVLPVFLGLAVTVRASGRGSVFVRKLRIGRDGRPFGVLAFRTTVADPAAEAGLPRVTPAGRFLRRHGLDDLPQLLDVVRGEMSLVGPRPALPHASASHGAGVPLIKPGLTGLWPAGDRSTLCWDDAARLDVRYVENWSLTLDLMIIGRSLRAAWRGRSAP
jgi:lipopolysaccharide/colanic/teichoic acid biosynthesis glycosyltransferase